MSQLAIDWTRCDGHGLCHALLPELIGQDEWGFPIILKRDLDEDRSGELLANARTAVHACPALALRIETVRAKDLHQRR